MATPALEPRDLKIAAFVITYRRPRILERTLRIIAEQGLRPFEITVLDNGACDETADVAKAYGDWIRYVRLTDNVGPAGAAAIGCREAMTRSPLVYWVDDDDPPRTVDTLERLAHLAVARTSQPIGAVGASGSRWSWRRGELQRLNNEELKGPIDVDAIGAGCQLIISSDALRAAGLPTPELFFGYEEVEFCLRLRRAGYRLVVDGDLHLEYRRQAGRLDIKPDRALLPRVSSTAAWRSYYSTRNYIHFMQRTFGRPDLARRQAVKACGKALLSWRRGPKYGALMTGLQARAVIDGYRGTLGRTVMPQGKSET